MKAWRFHGFGDMRLDEVPDPPRRADHVVAQPLVVQPSVTEAQVAQGIPTLAYDRVKRRLETEAPLQLFGHEFCARVVETGADVTRFIPAIVWRLGPSCRAVNARYAGQSEATFVAWGRCWASICLAVFAELASLPEIALVKVDDRISDSEAACLQSLSDSVAAVETAELRIGDSVAIFGQGSMGLECLQVARLSGAGLVITVDVRDEACSMSRKLGADHALNAHACDVVATIRELTGGIGADVVFECAGGSPKQGLAGQQTLTQAIDAVRSGGKIVGVSFFGGPLEVNVDLLRERSLRYVFPDVSTQAHLEHTVRLVASGRIRLKSTITHVLRGIESVPQAFEITANKGKYLAINPAQVVISA